MSGSWLATAVALLVCGFAVAACDTQTIVLADIVPDDAGTPANPPIRCVKSADCAENQYCEKGTCDAPAGTCSFIPTAACPNTETAVCGCDGVNYFNKCLRQSAGVEGDSTGMCSPETSLGCGGVANAVCPKSTSCGRFVSDSEPGPQCPLNPPGTCWGLPTVCPSADPTSTTDPLWDDCAPGGAHCLETCAAIQNGSVYHRSESCGPP